MEGGHLDPERYKSPLQSDITSTARMDQAQLRSGAMDKAPQTATDFHSRWKQSHDLDPERSSTPLKPTLLPPLDGSGSRLDPERTTTPLKATEQQEWIRSHLDPERSYDSLKPAETSLYLDPERA